MNKSSFLIVGQHAVIEALRNPKRKVLKVFLTEESKKNIHRKNPKKNVLEDVKVYFKSKKELDKYTSKDQIMHGGYIAEVEHIDQPDLKEFIKGKNKLTFVCIDEVTDPRNIGSLIRSASSFHIDGLIVKERQFPSDSKLMYKSASGAIEYMNIFQVSNINSTLKNLKDKNLIYSFSFINLLNLLNQYINLNYYLLILILVPIIFVACYLIKRNFIKQKLLLKRLLRLNLFHFI